MWPGIIVYLTNVVLNLHWLYTRRRGPNDLLQNNIQLDLPNLHGVLSKVIRPDQSCKRVI